MKTLDRYVIRSFLLSALLLGVSVLALRIVADLFFNMDEFLEQSNGLLAFLAQVGSYYGCHLLAYFTELGGVIIVLAAAFTFARMNHTNELTAMLASGVSLHRVIVPIVVCAVLLGLAIVVDREVLIPPNATRLLRSRDQTSEFGTYPLNLPADGLGNLWFSPRYDGRSGLMSTPIVTIRDEQRRRLATAVSNGTARRVTFRLPDRGTALAGWDLSAAALSRAGSAAGAWERVPTVERIYTSVGPEALLAAAKRLVRRHNVGPAAAPAEMPPDELLRGIRHLPPVADDRYGMTVCSCPDDPNAHQLLLDPPREGRPRTGRLVRPVFVYRMPPETPGGAGTLLGAFHADLAEWSVSDPNVPPHWELYNGRLFVASDLTSDDIILRQSSRWLDYMSYAQLTQLLRLNRVPDRQSAELARHVRFADPINNLVMLLLVLPFILSRERNIKAAASLSVLMGAAYFAFVYACRLMGLPPIVGAFLPIVLFGPVSVIMLDSVKT